MKTKPLSAAVALLGVTVLCGGCSFTPMSQGAFVQQAQRLHDGALASATVGEPRVNEYLQKVVRRLNEAAKVLDPKRAADPVLGRLTVHIIDSPVVNVVNTGGEHLYLYAGMLKLADTEEELAAMLAHAYAHSLRLDVQNTKIRPDPNDPPERIVWQFVNNPLTPEQERGATEQAFELYARGGWDVDRYAGLYQRLIAAGLGAGSGGRPPLSQTLAWAQQQAAKVSAEQRMWWRKETVADEDTFRERREQALGLAPGRREDLLVAAMPGCLVPGETAVQQAAQSRVRMMFVAKVNPQGRAN